MNKTAGAAPLLRLFCGLQKTFLRGADSFTFIFHQKYMIYLRKYEKIPSISAILFQIRSSPPRKDFGSAPHFCALSVNFVLYNQSITKTKRWERGDAMLILLVRREKKALGELRQLVWQCYPGSDALAFTDAAQALAFVEGRRLDIDLCITDVQLSGMTGLRLVRQLRQRDRRTKAVLISASRAYGLDAWRAGASDYLLEPVTLDSVRHTIGNCSPFLSGYQAEERRGCSV